MSAGKRPEPDNPRIPKFELPVVPADDHPYRRAGVLLLLITVGAFGGWAAYAPLSSAVIAQGEVRVEQRHKQVQHLEGGVVAAIEVEEGERVAAGQVLLRLSGVQARAELRAARLRYFGVLAERARLRAEQGGDEAPDFPAELVVEAANDPEIQVLLEGQTSLFLARRDTLASKKQVLEERIGELQARILGMEERSVSAKKRIRSYQAEIADLESLYARQMVDKVRLLQGQRELAETEDDLAQYSSEKSQAQAQIEVIRAQVVQLEQDTLQEGNARLREIELSLAELTASMASLRDTLERTELRAPVSGVVTGLLITTIGAVVIPGEVIMDIVPETGEYVIEARVVTTDIDEVSVGLPADVRFPAFNRVDTEILPGQVIQVSADAFQDPALEMSYFKTEVRLSDAALNTIRQADLSVVPGMPATVAITTGERTFLRYLAGPLFDMLMKAFREK